MKKVFIILFWPSILYGQSKQIHEPDPKYLITDAVDICNLLHIPKRKAIFNDKDALIFYPNTSMKGLSAYFIEDKRTYVVPKEGPDYRYYLKPMVEGDPRLFEIAFQRKDTTLQGFYLAKSILLHELVHYLQSKIGNAGPSNVTKSFAENIADPAEKEAYAAQAYYLLNHIDQQKLQQVMMSGLSGEKLKEALINEYFVHLHPSLKPYYK